MSLRTARLARFSRAANPSAPSAARSAAKFFLAVVALALFPVAARAEKPLTPLPAADIAALAKHPLADDLALIESNPDGTMKQVTLFAWVAAPPALLRAVIATPGDYKQFIPNLSQSVAETLPDGTIRQTWKMDLPVSSFDGINIFKIEPGAILLHAIDPNDDATYRYELYPSGSGTLLVQYGYTDVKHSNAFVRAFVKRQPMMEHGLGLAAQLLFVSAMRGEAQRRAGTQSSRPADRATPDLSRLKERGQVALMGDNKLVQVVDRVYAAKTAVWSAISQVGDYDKFVPGVGVSSPRAAAMPGAIGYYVEISTPLVGWSTTYEMRGSSGSGAGGGAGGFDGAGVSGDLKGARFRWLVSSAQDGATAVSYTVQEELSQSSMLLRQLFKFQPSLERGIDVALALVWMRAIRGRAEHWK